MGNTASSQGITREDVKSYLQLYHMGAERRHILEDRRRRIIGELKAAYDLCQAPPSPAIKEIEMRLISQREEAENMMLHALELIELLPPKSVERATIELRHIYCLPWRSISVELFLARSNVICRYNAALDMLIDHNHTADLISKVRTKNDGIKASL